MTGVTSGAPPRIGSYQIMRTTAKGTLSRYLSGLPGADHQLKIGGQLERGEHDSTRHYSDRRGFTDNNGRPFQSVSADPSNIGGAVLTVSAFASDALTIGDRLTVNAGLRFDHSRAFSAGPARPRFAGSGNRRIVPGGGTLYTWNILSPRLGVTMKLTADGRTLLRASYGRFSQGVLTGEIEPFHPGAIADYDESVRRPDRRLLRVLSIIEPNVKLALDPQTRAPRTDEYSIGVDREVGRRLAVAIAYVHKDGDHFIGWTETAVSIVNQSAPFPTPHRAGFPSHPSVPPASPALSAEESSPVLADLQRSRHGRREAAGRRLAGARLVYAVEGLRAAGLQRRRPRPARKSAPCPRRTADIFGRDPNDLTNARGRLPNDRPHMFRSDGQCRPRPDRLRACRQHAALHRQALGAEHAGRVAAERTQRVLLEPRGSRRLSSQSLLDLRVSRTFSFRGAARVQFILDVLNVLDDSAEEGLATDNWPAPNFARASRSSIRAAPCSASG